MEDLVTIGTVNGTHHLLGTVKVTSVFEDFDKIIDHKVILKKENDTKILTVCKVKRLNLKKILIDFKEIENINEAKNINGYTIKIRRDLLPEKNSDNFYNVDIIGLKVYEKDKYIGEITDILDTAGHDVLVVNNDDNEILIPYVKDVFIMNIDFKNSLVEVKLIDGMLE